MYQLGAIMRCFAPNNCNYVVIINYLYTYCCRNISPTLAIQHPGNTSTPVFIYRKGHGEGTKLYSEQSSFQFLERGHLDRKWRAGCPRSLPLPLTTENVTV